MRQWIPVILAALVATGCAQMSGDDKMKMDKKDGSMMEKKDYKMMEKK